MIKTKNKIAMALVAFSMAVAQQAHAANIFILNAPPTANVGSTFDVTVSLDSYNNLAGFQFDLLYNPSLVTLSSILAGTIFDPNTFFIPGTDDTLGSITANAGSLSGAGGVSGTSGLLTTFTFQAISVGFAAFSVDLLQLVDADSLPITPDNGGSVTTELLDAVPEPGTVSLLAGGLSLLAFWQRKRAS